MGVGYANNTTVAIIARHGKESGLTKEEIQKLNEEEGFHSTHIRNWTGYVIYTCRIEERGGRWYLESDFEIDDKAVDELYRNRQSEVEKRQKEEGPMKFEESSETASPDCDEDDNLPF